MGATQFGMSEFKVLSVYESEDGLGLKYEVEARRKPTQCPNCKSSGSLQTHSIKTRTIRDLPLSGKQVILEAKVRRYKCLSCGKTFVEQFQNIDDSLFTKRLRDSIVKRVLRRETFTRIAKDYSVTDKTVRRLFDEWADAHAYLLRYDTPRILGLDEAHIDDRYRLVVVDIEKQLLLDMLPDNKPQTVKKYLKALPNRNNVQAVTMDFFDGYANYVRECFPYRPLIVIDKFHVIQLINRKLDAVRKRVHAEEKAKSTAKAKKLKNERKLFMSNLDDLDAEAIAKLDEWMKAYPVLEDAFMLKEMFRGIYDLPFRVYAEESFDDWCSRIPDTLPEFQSLRDTFISRREHILNYFDARFTNAFAESANNIIKGIEKQGKGYDFDTLRKIALLSSRVAPAGTFDYKTAVFVQSHEF